MVCVRAYACVCLRCMCISDEDSELDKARQLSTFNTAGAYSD